MSLVVTMAEEQGPLDEKQMCGGETEAVLPRRNMRGETRI